MLSPCDIHPSALSVIYAGISHIMGTPFGIDGNRLCHSWEQNQNHIQLRNSILHGSQTCRPVALEYDPAGHGAQTEDDVAPAVACIQ